VRRALLLALSLAAPTVLDAQRPVAITAPDSGVVRADEYGAGLHAVVLAHGGRHDKSSWQPQARALAAAGFRVLAIDFRAVLASRAGRESACLYDETCLAVDVLAAVRHLRSTGARKVSVVGGSLGGGAAAQASVESRKGEIDGIVLLAHMPIAAPERMKGRKLFIVARNDLGSADVPRSVGVRKQYEKAPEPKALLLLEGAAHAQAIFATAQGDRLLREIAAFLSAP